jgi:hypothetical protein
MLLCRWCQRGGLIGTMYRHIEIRINSNITRVLSYSELLRNTGHKHMPAEAVVLLE